MDLADPAFGHPEHLAYLREREALVVVQGEHDLLPVTKPIDGPCEDLLHLLHLVSGHGAVLAVGEGVAQSRRLAPVTAREHLVQGHYAHERDLRELRLQLRLRHPKLSSYLCV